jgi:hypothetical protein
MKWRVKRSIMLMSQIGFAVLEDLDPEVEINNIWVTIRENINVSAKESLGYYELKKHKLWFNEGCTKL